MPESAEEWLGLLAGLEKRFDAVYRKAAAAFGMPPCTMWVLYFVASSREPLSQQELHAMMMFPKQTINSAVARLAAGGAVALDAMPAGRGRKAVRLTPAGEALCRRTVLALREAECRAVEALGPEKMAAFAGLYADLLHAVEKGLREKGLAD